MQLIYYPDPRLLEVCIVAPSQPEQDRARLAAKMWKIMRKKRGVGLATTQVGLNIRMFVWKENGYDQAIWNPSLTFVSGSTESIEGCLSLPKVNVTIQRSTSSVLNGQGVNGLPLKFVGNSNATRIWQHEIDHLDGKLIIDNMNRDDTLINKDALIALLNSVAN